MRAIRESMDTVRKEVRSRIMAAVRSRGNRTTEIVLGELLRTAGLRGYRKHWPVPGKPDFAWPGRKIAVFVDGCFWHGCTCRSLPSSNIKFWKNKIETNRSRDRRVTRLLRSQGWKVVRIWECRVKRISSLRRVEKLVESSRLSARENNRRRSAERVGCSDRPMCASGRRQ
jgi:DNA mismatch endonuclease (patch repair protein)